MNPETTSRFSKIRKVLDYVGPRLGHWETLAKASVAIIGGIIDVAGGVRTVVNAIDPPASTKK